MSKIITSAQVKELYNISKPIMPVPIHWWKLDEVGVNVDIVNGSSPTSAYTSSGTDENLTSPSDSYNQDDCFQPLTATGGTGPFGILAIGGKAWSLHTTAGPGKSLGYENLGGAYGSVNYSMGASPNWDGVADSQYNGIQRIWLPKSANNDKLGGYIDFYFHRDAFYNAFYGNTSACIIARNGSVYKTSISPANLVVRWDGEIGPKGASPEDTGSSSINAVNNGAIINQDGFRGKCYDASDGYIDLGEVVHTSRYTYCCWMWLYDYGTVGCRIYSAWTGSGTTDAVLMRIESNGSFSLFHRQSDQSQKSCNSTITALPIGQWVFLAGTADGSYLRRYINGVNVGTNLAYDDTINEAAKQAYIGRYSTSNMNAKMRDFRIYGRALSVRELTDIYRGLE